MSVQALSCAMAIRGVSASEKLVMLVLANFADEAMSCWPSHKRLADDTGLTQRTVLSVLRTLEDKRLLSRAERKRADGSRTSDKITLHFSGEVISPRGETISGGGEITDTGVGKPTAGGGEIISPLTTFEPSTEPSVKLVSDANASGAAAPDDPDTSAWRRAKILLMAQGGMSFDAAGKFFGRLLSVHGIEARELLGPIGEAEANMTLDPQSYLTAAAKARAKRRQTGPPKRVSWV